MELQYSNAGKWHGAVFVLFGRSRGISDDGKLQRRLAKSSVTSASSLDRGADWDRREYDDQRIHRPYYKANKRDTHYPIEGGDKTRKALHYPADC